ncbi:response regulator transcription factor [Butyrivibrio sp. MC2013]|uniref:response regulator transcription factor n=1 Tax=Butyrivibrio sp. MC2013 TaxID=1280686 RepID=UPI0003FC0FB4|nr:response regulator transcription factor [Butyrivibrio sp. MC2013]
MYKILMVDDDKEVLSINKKFFENNDCSVMICSDPLTASRTARNFNPDCILLDVMMPGMDGYELCRDLRGFTNAPILFLSGKVSEEAKEEGFMAGCDDYIEKPYNIREVYMRIVANIRRNRAVAGQVRHESNTIEISPLTIQTVTHTVTAFGEEIPLSGKEYEVLRYLVDNAGREVTFEDIGISIWGSYSEADRRSVTVNVSRLRKKLTEYTGMDNLIETVWGYGYRFVSR